MANVYPGINNYNEYYTNHYFSSIFQENTATTISEWRDAARLGENLRTPWALLRDCGRQYYMLHEKFLRARSSYQIIPLVKQLADSYLSALGYPEASPFKADLSDGSKFPVYLEIKKSNGMPLLWVVLSLNKNDEEAIKILYKLHKQRLIDNASKSDEVYYLNMLSDGKKLIEGPKNENTTSE